jgi:hypothetical protein
MVLKMTAPDPLREFFNVVALFSLNRLGIGLTRKLPLASIGQFLHDSAKLTRDKGHTLQNG